MNMKRNTLLLLALLSLFFVMSTASTEAVAANNAISFKRALSAVQQQASVPPTTLKQEP